MTSAGAPAGVPAPATWLPSVGHYPGGASYLGQPVLPYPPLLSQSQLLTEHARQMAALQLAQLWARPQAQAVNPGVDGLGGLQIGVPGRLMLGQMLQEDSGNGKASLPNAQGMKRVSHWDWFHTVSAFEGR